MSSTKEITLAILIDAFRHDFLGNKTPYLLSLAESGVTGVIEPPLSFSLHPTWFAGLRPKTSNKFAAYVYSPEAPMYGLLRLIYSSRRTRVLRLVADLAMHALFPYAIGFAWHIPTKMLKYFDVADKLPPWHPQYLPHATTLFEILRNNNRKWLFIGSPGSHQGAVSIVNKFQRMLSEKQTFLWLHFAELDWACHKYGPESVQSKRKLQEIDEAIEKIHRRLSNTGRKVNVLVFGDHGHVPVDRTFDLQKLLAKMSSRIGEDYVYFLDSTMARFWFKNDHAQDEIAHALSTVDCGKVLSKEDLCRYGLDFQNASHGQFIWAADGGCIISPNFWQGTIMVKGMHGHLPEVQSNHSRFVLCGPQVPESVELKEKNKLVDIFPTLLDLMRFHTPETNEGLSILSKVGKN